MKYFSIKLIIILVIRIECFSQQLEKMFFDKNGQECDSIGSYYYSIWPEGVEDLEMRSYYTSTGSLKSVQRCSNNDLHGEAIYYHPNQTLYYKTVYYNGKAHGNVEFFYPTGRLQTVRAYDSSSTTQTGKQRQLKILEYYDSIGNQTVKNGVGEIKEIIQSSDGWYLHVSHYKNGLADSIWVGYYESGSIYFKEKWKDGDLMSGESFNRNGENFHYSSVIEQAEPNGGIQSFYREIYSNLVYPKKARRLGTEGKVQVQFFVDKEGNVVRPKVVKGISTECDAAALDAFLNLKRWRPTLNRGQTIEACLRITVIFKLK